MTHSYHSPDRTDAGQCAMVLAAGFGQRMRPLTELTPKPLIKVAGKSLIDYGLDRLRDEGVKKVVVNAHYLADQIFTWAAHKSSPEIVISDERDEILDTGGGIAKALGLLGSAPFFVLNSDSFWLDGARPALENLRLRWDGAVMDCLLLLCPLDRTVGYDGAGDFTLAADGRIARYRGDGALAYIGGYLVHPRIFDACPQGAFSMNALWDRAISQKRLFGLAHDGKWLHVGTPGGLVLAEAELAKT